VDVAGSDDIATIMLILSQPGGGATIAEQPGPDAHFDLQMPETAIGPQNLVAAGVDAGGRLVAVSATVTVDVTVPSPLDNITVYPPVVYLRPCASASLEITGHYEDGQARDLSFQPGLTMSFATGSAERSGASEVVLNDPLDDTLIVTFDGVDSAVVPIRVLAPDDLSLCTGATTTTTTAPPSPTTTSSTSPLPSTTTSTIVPGETTTTTDTAPPASPTTTSTTTSSTVPSPCQDDTGCDDGDACTVDVCTVTGCAHVAVPGLEGAECLLSAALDQALCQVDTIDPRLAQFATAKLERALARMERAAETTKPNRQRRLLDKAARALGKITRHKPGTTTGACLESLAARIDAILAAIDR
jgi:hypothetical protein